MSDTERKWREGLKVGHEVAVFWCGGSIPLIGTVAEISSHGVRVSLNSGTLVRFCILSGCSLYHGTNTFISPVTSDFRAASALYNGVDKFFREHRLPTLTLSQLRRIAAILDENKEQNDDTN